MAPLSLPPFAAGQPAARVDACLREALAACEQARQCAVLWFAEVQRRSLFRELGHASLQLYATQALGFSDNRYRQFKRLADDLERLPALRDAVAAGELGWTKAQQVARVASPDTQSAWVARAKTTGRRELERDVRAACARQRPARRSEGQLELVPSAANAAAAAAATGVAAPAAASAKAEGLAPARLPSTTAARAPAHADAPRHTISLQFDAMQLARFEALVERVRQRRLVPARADRAEVVLAALAALADGSADACAGHAAGSDDAPPAAAPRGRARSSPPVQVVVHRCPDCDAAAIVTSRGEIALPPARAAAVDCDARVRREGGPNRAIVPPRLRAAVMARDRHRCAAPGCGSARFLEVHHVVPRSAGGANEAANLVTLCSRCHGFVHEQGLRAPAHAACAPTISIDAPRDGAARAPRETEPLGA